MSGPPVTPAQLLGNPEDSEMIHVHEVYDKIASHFSSTRYKVRPWPIIADFMSSLPNGSIGLDSGTGNGKYLPLPLNRSPGSIWTIGLDRSCKLLEIASAGSLREVIRGDALQSPWRPGLFDYAISIATIHHLSTHSRRVKAIERLINAVSPHHGRVLIYVWAIEQDSASKRIIPQGADTNDSLVGMDVFVPWVLNNSAVPDAEEPKQVYQRYYHLFEHNELRSLAIEAAKKLGLVTGTISDVHPSQQVEGIEIVQDGWERSNLYIELRRWKSAVQLSSV